MFFLISFKDVDDCVNHTCQNDGSCVDGVNNYSCNCSPEFTGDRCEIGRYFLVPALLSALYFGVFCASLQVRG